MHHGQISKPIADWSKARAAVQGCTVCGFADWSKARAAVQGCTVCGFADGLIALRQRIDKAGIPFSKLDETLNLATWNIRELGGNDPHSM